MAIRSDEGLTLETSAFQIFHGGNFTFINSFDKTKFLLKNGRLGIFSEGVKKYRLFVGKIWIAKKEKKRVQSLPFSCNGMDNYLRFTLKKKVLK